MQDMVARKQLELNGISPQLAERHEPLGCLSEISQASAYWLLVMQGVVLLNDYLPLMGAGCPESGQLS